MARFNYKGFRYVEVTSSKPVALDQNSLTAYFVHSDVPQKGEINTSNPLVNRLWWATNNAYLSNLMGYPTDCPQREKNGWTGDGHFAIETALYNYDGITVYEKWLADHRDEQQPNGVLPDIIPTGGWGYGTDNGLELDEYNRHYSLEYLSVLRRQQIISRLLRKHQTICRLRRPYQPKRTDFMGKRRLGSREIAFVQRTDLIGILLCRY